MDSLIRVVLVDDDKNKLEQLTEKLEKSKEPRFDVTGFSSPYDAYKYIKTERAGIDFVFSDHIFTAVRKRRGENADCEFHSGIDFVRAVSTSWPEIGVILYTGDELVSEKDEWTGLAAGALRFVNVAQTHKVVDEELIREVRELRELTDSLNRLRESEQCMAILQRAVKVGVNLIDRRFKVHFTNEDYMAMIGNSGHPHRFCCSRFHNRDWPPCRGCLVCRSLCTPRPNVDITRQGRQRIFFSPVYPQGNKEYKYLHVWAEPVYSKISGDMPLAVMETLMDMTESPTLENMAVEKHLDILLSSVADLVRPNSEPQQVPICRDGLGWLAEDTRQVYMRTRVYTLDIHNPASPRYIFFGSSPALSFSTEDLGFSVTLNWEEIRRLSDDAIATRLTDIERYIDDYGRIKEALGLTAPPLVFALSNSHFDPIGLFVVDCEPVNAATPPLSELDVDLLLPYAQEIARVLERKQGRNIPKVEQYEVLDAVNAKLKLAATPESALQTVVEGIVGECGISMGHIRISRRDSFDLVAGLGRYYSVAKDYEGRSSLPANDPTSLSASVARNGFPAIINSFPNLSVEKALAGMLPQEREALSGMKSCAAFPLRVSGEVLGVLALQSDSPEVFTPETVLLCTRLAEVASYALHDQQLQLAGSERGWRRAAGLFAHKMGNCLPVTVYKLRNIIESHEVATNIKNDAEEALQEVFHAQNLVKNLREHVREPKLHLTDAVVHDVFLQIVNRCQKVSQEAHIFLACALDPTVIMKVDVLHLTDAFLALVQDSIKFHPTNSPTIRVCVRHSLRPLLSGFLHVTYQDDGPGITGPEKESIFEPLQTTHDDGMGLGLTYTREIIEKHGGRIREVGIEGKGVEFEMLFPIEQEEDQS